NGNCNPVNTTAAIALLPLPSANAGQDQYVCRNSSATLSASTAAGVSYSWKTKLGTPAGTGPVTNVTASADTTVIILIVQDSKGCSSSDTINVFAVDPVSFTISDACYTSGMSLNAHPANASSAGVYQWYLNGTILGGQNDSTIHVSKAGTYKISYTLGSCSFNATAQVIAPPSLITKRKRISCTGSALAISTLSTPSSGVSYAWSTGSTPVGGNSASVSITTLMDTTMYLVDVTSSTSLCAAHDSVMVIGINKPQPVMNDSVGCQGLAVLLNGRPSNITNLDSLNPVYSWKFNQQTLPTTNDSLSAGNAGVYYVTVTADACAGTDSAQISFNALPDSPADLVSFCSDGGSAKLDALNPGSTYLWKASLETSQIIFVSNAGTYAVAITNASHCTLKDSIKVQDLCPPTFYVPNTFTPDCSNCIDTLDRHYRVYGKHIQNLSFTVFSRWGEIIFHTNNKHDAWDGTYKGVPMPIGEYDYIYTFEGDTDEYKGPYKGKGAIMLLR
ncbi:MAG: gliding motility-associated C-terminal domain-containing protein, partial [Cytophagaceae bacterium]